MTISTVSSSQTFVGNGSTTTFTFTFVADNANDLEVIYTDTDGNSSTLNPSVYSVVITATPVGSLWGIGGIVTYPLIGSAIAAGTTLTVNRIVPYTQDISISNQGAFYPAAVEQGLDVLELQIQQIENKQSFDIQAPVVDISPQMILPAAAARANGYLGFDSAGNVTVFSSTPPTIPPYTAQTIATVSALKALGLTSLSLNTVYYVRGYYTDNDGGEGFFTLTNVNPGADNGGTIIHSNLTGYYFLRPDVGFINARWFGAKGDNSTNDYTALFNAVAATRALSTGQSTLYIPVGRYILGNQLDISGISVIGAGTIETILKRSSTSTDNYTVKLDDTAYGGGSSNQLYMNFQIDGNQANNSHANFALGLIGNTLLNTFINIFIQNAKTKALYFIANAGNQPNANTFIRLTIQNCPCDAIEIRCGESNKFIGTDIETIVGRFVYLSGTDVAVGPLSFDTFYFETNGDTSLDAVRIEGNSGQIEFKYGSVREYGKTDGSAGSGFNLATCSQVVLEGLVITPAAGSSGSNHWKIVVGGSSGNNVFRNMKDLTYADVSDSSATSTYTNCGYLGAQLLWVWNVAAIAPGETWYFSPGCPVGTMAASGVSVRGRIDGRQGFVALYTETSHVISGGDQIIITLMKGTGATSLISTLTSGTGSEYIQANVSMSFGDTFTVRMLNTSASDTIAIGTVGVMIAIRK